MTDKLETIVEREMPDTFTSLLGKFVNIYDMNFKLKTDSAMQQTPKTFEGYVTRKLSQQYPLLDPQALNAEREIILPIDKDIRGNINRMYSAIYSSVCGTVLPDEMEKKINNLNNITLRLPLFFVSSHEKITRNGKISFDSDCWLDSRSGYQYHIDSCRFGIRIEAKTPVAPDTLNCELFGALAKYYSAISEASSRFKIEKDVLKTTPPEIQILWVPSVDTLELQSPYTDPALLMEYNGNRYVIGLWDIGKDEVVDIKNAMREWTSGERK